MKLWNHSITSTDQDSEYRLQKRLGCPMQEKLSGASLAAMATASGRSIVQLLDIKVSSK